MGTLFCCDVATLITDHYHIITRETVVTEAAVNSWLWYFLAGWLGLTGGGPGCYNHHTAQCLCLTHTTGRAVCCSGQNRLYSPSCGALVHTTHVWTIITMSRVDHCTSYRPQSCMEIVWATRLSRMYDDESEDNWISVRNSHCDWRINHSYSILWTLHILWEHLHLSRVLGKTCI